MLLFAVLMCGTNVWGEQINESFEGSSFPPTDWSSIHVKGDSWTRVTSSEYYVTPHSGTYEAKVAYKSSGADNYLITPQLRPVSGESLKFYLASQKYSGTTVTIEVSTTDNTSASSFTTVLGTYASNSDITNSWGSEKTISLEDYAGQDIYVAFHVVDNNGAHIYLDDVSGVSLKPETCPKPTSLAYSNLTSSSVDLAWTEEGTASNWNVLYKATGDADWTVVAVTANPYTLALQPSKHYEVKVQADCGGGDESKFSNVVSFDTPCGVYSLPYNEDFSGNIDCWTKVSCESGSVLSSGAFMFAYNSNPPQYLISPELATTENPVKVEFEYKARGSWTESFNVGYSTTTSETSAFTWDEGTTYNSTTFASYSKLFPAGVKYIALQYTANDQYGLYIDNLSISEYVVPTCFVPTALGASAITANSATLTWMAGKTGDDAWVVEYSTKSDFSSDVHSLNATAASQELTGLEAQTTYYARVKTNCGTNGESEYAEAVSFTTACSAKTAPWSENFEDETANAVPACWSKAGSTATTSTGWGAPTEAIWAIYSYSSNKSIRMCNAYANTGVAQVTSPVITLPASPAYEFKFDYAHTATCGNFKVQISADGGENFTDLGEYGPTVASPSSYNGGSNPETFKTDEVISLAAYSGNIVMRFVANANYEGGAIFIDNIAIREAPTCMKPVLGDATAITPEGATFSWTAGADETQYDYCVVASGAAADGWVTLDENVRTFTVTGKAAGTTYDFYVRSNCGGSDGVSEAVKKSFTTATVPAPASVNITGITNNSATATWTAADVTYPVQYQYALVQSGDPIWSEAAANHSVDLSGLEANTEYTIYVRTYYSAGVQSAEASTTFTTACDPVTISTDAYVEHFETFPACWNNAEGTTTTASYKWSSYSGGKEGNGLRFDSYNNMYHTNVLASPMFVLNADADLTFWAKNPKGGDYKVQIAVDGGERQYLLTGMTNIAAWTQKEVSLSEYQGKTIQLFFCATSNDGSGDAYLYLDELAITPQACRKPATLNEATAITAEGATLTWTAGGSAADYQYAVAEAGQIPVWEAENVVSELAVTLSGLQASTSYDFYVRTYCGAESQSEARMVSFKTNCGVYGLPFAEDFNALANYTVPDCWDNAEGTTTSDSYKWRANSGVNGKYMAFDSYSNESGNTNILATPQIQLGTGDYLSFQCKNKDGGDFKVQIQAEGEERADLLTGLTGIAEWTKQEVNLSAYNGKKVQFFFCGTSNGAPYSEGVDAHIYVDDIRVARTEVFNDTEDNEDRFATLAAAGETMDVIFNRTLLYSGDYNTLCLPFSLSAEQIAKSPLAEFKLKAFDYASVAGDELQIAICGTSSIEAGVPYFAAYQGAPMANQTQQIFQDVVITATAPGSVSSSDVEYHGIFNPVSLTKSSDNLYLAAGNTIYWPIIDNKQVRGFRAYFQVVTGGPHNVRRGMPVRLVERAEVTTGVENVHDEDPALKVLENGQVVIIRNGAKYNLQGQKIQ